MTFRLLSRAIASHGRSKFTTPPEVPARTQGVLTIPSYLHERTVRQRQGAPAFFECNRLLLDVNPSDTGGKDCKHALNDKPIMVPSIQLLSFLRGERLRRTE